MSYVQPEQLPKHGARLMFICCVPQCPWLGSIFLMQSSAALLELSTLSQALCYLDVFSGLFSPHLQVYMGWVPRKQCHWLVPPHSSIRAQSLYMLGRDERLLQCSVNRPLCTKSRSLPCHLCNTEIVWRGRSCSQIYLHLSCSQCLAFLKEGEYLLKEAVYNYLFP